MLNKFMKTALVAALFAAGTASATPTLIDFEGGPTGTGLSGYDYAGLGVVLSSVGGSGVQEYNYGGSLTETLTSDDWYHPMLFSFVNPADSGQAWTVNSFSLLNRLNEDEWHVTAYDINGAVLATQTISYAVGTINFSGVGAIHSVLLDAHVTAFAADNLQFDGLAAPVPEPSSYAMLALGLGLLGWRARRG